MGDHRSDSSDSRYHDDGTGATGSVPIDKLVGRALFIVWPIDHVTWLGVPERTFAQVPTPATPSTTPTRPPSTRARAASRAASPARGDEGRGGLSGTSPVVPRPVPSRKPSLRVERALQRSGHRLLAGMDEVGRGALAGPVSVGVVVIDETVRSAPVGRQGLQAADRARAYRARAAHPALGRRVCRRARGPDEIDAIGIMVALRLAGTRALDSLGSCPTSSSSTATTTG